jgi:hypothetical protein
MQIVPQPTLLSGNTKRIPYNCANVNGDVTYGILIIEVINGGSNIICHAEINGTHRIMQTRIENPIINNTIAKNIMKSLLIAHNF